MEEIKRSISPTVDRRSRDDSETKAKHLLSPTAVDGKITFSTKVQADAKLLDTTYNKLEITSQPDRCHINYCRAVEITLICFNCYSSVFSLQLF